MTDTKMFKARMRGATTTAIPIINRGGETPSAPSNRWHSN
jgi:hypothetical protein